jgi:ribosomal protein S18 acetylase RimI-like enzyme
VGRAEKAPLTIRDASGADRADLLDLLDAWGMRPVARLGEVYDPADDPAIVAVDASGAVTGVLTYRPGDDGWELGTFYVTDRRAGVGTRMLELLVELAGAGGARRIWLVTTNDNVDALRFYQRRGFRFVELHAGAVDRSRATLKPSIPAIGDHGIPLRDELVLERVLD